MRSRLAAAVLVAATGASVAAAQDRGGAAPGPAPSWTATPQVPGSAHRLVPFGFETAGGTGRAWALGEAGRATVFLTRGEGGAWAIAGPRLEGLRPAGGDAPQHAAELAADGHGALLAVPAGEADADAVLFVREPGAAFARAPEPGVALAGGERLVADAATSAARPLLAVAPGDGGTFVAPSDGDGVGRAVLRHAGGAWTREPIEAPGRTLRAVGLAAGGPGELWLLARDGDAIVLLARQAAAGAPPRWAPVTIAGPLPAGAAVAPPPAEPLTATAGGLWLDVRLTVAGTRRDATLHLATDGAQQPTVDGRWCDVEALCDHGLGFAFADGARGYRSVATPATGALPFGRRFVSAPVDTDVAADAPRRSAQRQGGFAALAGERFVLADGIGEDGTSTTQAIALDDAGGGLTGGTQAFGAITPGSGARPGHVPVERSEVAIVAAASSPSGDGRVLALLAFGGAKVYEPGVGWSFTALSLSASGGPDDAPISARPSRGRARAW